MKKALLLGLMITLFYSCDDREEFTTSKIETIKETNFFKSQQEKKLNEFKNDENIHFLMKDYQDFIKYSKSSNYTGMINSNISGKKNLEQLFKKYGEQNVFQYLEELSNNDRINSKVDGSHDGSSCTLNLDGTTFWGNCSFWEGAQAYAAILVGCGSISIPGSTEQELIDYAKCNQSKICKYC